MNFAITMNARGGPGIVLATVAYANGIISLEFFTVLILTTMLSSLIAGYYLRYQQKKDVKIFDEVQRSDVARYVIAIVNYKQYIGEIIGNEYK